MNDKITLPILNKTPIEGGTGTGADYLMKPWSQTNDTVSLQDEFNKIYRKMCLDAITMLMESEPSLYYTRYDPDRDRFHFFLFQGPIKLKVDPSLKDGEWCLRESKPENHYKIKILWPLGESRFSCD